MENFQNSGGGGKGLYIGLGILAVVLIIVGGLMYYYWDNIKAWWSGEDEEKAKADKAKADKAAADRAAADRAAADRAAADRAAQTRPIREDRPTTIHSMSPTPPVNIGGTTTSPSIPTTDRATAPPQGASPNSSSTVTAGPVSGTVYATYTLDGTQTIRLITDKPGITHSIANGKDIIATWGIPAGNPVQIRINDMYIMTLVSRGAFNFYGRFDSGPVPPARMSVTKLEFIR
jgi:cytoskeletal protein RodZ